MFTLTTGKCHICYATTAIDYCERCGHWFCAECRGRWGARLLAAIKDYALPTPNCCGPLDSMASLTVTELKARAYDAIREMDTLQQVKQMELVKLSRQIQEAEE